ncbi:hypothetical protein CEXT_236201 [Caerostris extrusa]|uniref:Uncharacterized protein n=1 Tax=Caerostris extrusa TaxID=172846 RepID=A0AAV4SMV0_CAEEX|nr:hypothetical protein CEXT_236201 [Caerostris extrusa]
MEERKVKGIVHQNNADNLAIKKAKKQIVYNDTTGNTTGTNVLAKEFVFNDTVKLGKKVNATNEANIPYRKIETRDRLSYKRMKDAEHAYNETERLQPVVGGMNNESEYRKSEMHKGMGSIKLEGAVMDTTRISFVETMEGTGNASNITRVIHSKSERMNNESIAYRNYQINYGKDGVRLEGAGLVYPGTTFIPILEGAGLFHVISTYNPLAGRMEGAGLSYNNSGFQSAIRANNKKLGFIKSQTHHGRDGGRLEGAGLAYPGTTFRPRKEGSGLFHVITTYNPLAGRLEGTGLSYNNTADQEARRMKNKKLDRNDDQIRHGIAANHGITHSPVLKRLESAMGATAIHANGGRKLASFLYRSPPKADIMCNETDTMIDISFGKSVTGKKYPKW